MHGARGEPRGNSLFAYLSRVNKRVPTFVAQTIRTSSRHVFAFPPRRGHHLPFARDDSRYPASDVCRGPRKLLLRFTRTNNKSHADYAPATRALSFCSQKLEIRSILLAWGIHFFLFLLCFVKNKNWSNVKISFILSARFRIIFQ